MPSRAASREQVVEPRGAVEHGVLGVHVQVDEPGRIASNHLALRESSFAASGPPTRPRTSPGGRSGNHFGPRQSVWADSRRTLSATIRARAARLASTSASVGGGVAHRHPQDGPVVPAAAAHPGRPVGQHPALTTRVASSSEREAHAHLGVDDVVEHLDARGPSPRRRRTGRGPAQPGHQVLDPARPSERNAAQTTISRPRRDSSGTKSAGSPASDWIR